MSEPGTSALRPLAASTAQRRPDRRFAPRLVMRVVAERARRGSFLHRRAVLAVRGVADTDERRLLDRVLASSDVPESADALTALAALMEGRGRLAEATHALDTALRMAPDDPTLMLHAARVARKADDTVRAKRLYDRVGELSDGQGSLGRLAAVGHALLDAEPGRALSTALRGALRVGDVEIAAVAQEARAAVRRRLGDVDGALRDYLLAAVRYQERVDVGRVGHELADMLVSVGDYEAARVALVEVCDRALERQALWARSRLLVMARTLGDTVGQRRWADTPTSPLISLMPPRRASAGTGDGGRARRLGRAIRRLTTSR